MVGQFKSTVVCGQCSKISVCFDPYMLISLPIPTNKENSFYFIPQALDKGALKINFQYGSSSTLATICRQFTRLYNENYYQSIREGKRERLVEDRILFVTLDSDNFTIANVLPGPQPLSTIDQNHLLFLMQLPECRAGEEVVLCEYEYQSERISYPRFLRFDKSSGPGGKESVINQSLQRGLEKNTSRGSYSELVVKERASQVIGIPYGSLLIEIKKKLKLSTFVEGHN